MSNHAGYADVANNLSEVDIVAGEGLGMQRRCYGPKGENWLETCNLFESGQAYGFKVHTEAEDYRYPLSDLQGEWSVEPMQTGSKFTVRLEATLKGNAIGQAALRALAKRKYRAVLADLADGWAARMERAANS
ncbi:MAG: SRPBCC family protein [Pseudomonadota bacterium]